MGSDQVNPGFQLVATPYEDGAAPVIGRGDIGLHDTVTALGDGHMVDLVDAALQGQAAFDTAFAALGGAHATWYSARTAADKAGLRASALRLRTLAQSLAAASLL